MNDDIRERIASAIERAARDAYPHSIEPGDMGYQAGLAEAARIARETPIGPPRRLRKPGGIMAAIDAVRKAGGSDWDAIPDVEEFLGRKAPTPEDQS